MNVWTSRAESKGLNDGIVDYQAKELDEFLLRFFAEIRKSDDLKILSLNYFMLFAFNGVNGFHKKNSQSFFFH